MKHMLFASALLCTVVLTGLGQDKKETAEKGKESPKTVAMSGYVVDAMCAKGMAGKETTMKKAMGHSKECALDKDCAASGYGVFSDGKYYKFDEKGDAMAKGLIEKTTTEKGIMIDVTGTMKGETFVVASVTEHKEQEKSNSSAK